MAGKPNLRICLLLSEPNRPAVTEIYGKCLPSKGHDVLWVTNKRPSYNLSEEDLDKIKIYEILPRKHSPNLIKRYYNNLKCHIKVLNKLDSSFKRDKADVIQVRNSIYYGLVALILKRRFKIPFVYQYTFPHESYKYMGNNSFSKYLIYKFDGFLLNYVLKNADLIFPISELMKIELVKQGLPEEKMTPLPMGANKTFFSPEKSGSDVREKYDLKNSTVLLYLGTMDDVRKLEIIIHAFKIVDDSRKNVKLLMVGYKSPPLMELTSNLGLDNVIFTGKLPYLEVPEVIAATDIGLSPIPPIPIYHLSSPTKVFEYMSMGKPVIANREIQEQEKVLEESKCGILADYNPESFAEAMIKLIDNPENGKKLGKNGREWLLKNRDYMILTETVEESYYKLIDGN
jgi:glycosyltransferase involved in cell wall biosynthesis